MNYTYIHTEEVYTPKRMTISSGLNFLAPKALMLSLTDPNGLGRLTSSSLDMSPSLRPVRTRYSGPPPLQK